MTAIDRAWLVVANARLAHEKLQPLLSGQTSAADFVSSGGDLPEPERQAVLHPDETAIEQALKWCDTENHHLLHPDALDYPELLRQIPDAPILLYGAGNTTALTLPALAIVGSRNPTRGGVHNAFEFSRFLGGSGFCIVSGLAQGVDTAAHRGALAAGAMTVAVLGHGIDRVYPAVKHQLAHAPQLAEHTPDPCYQRQAAQRRVCLGRLVARSKYRGDGANDEQRIERQDVAIPPFQAAEQQR